MNANTMFAYYLGIEFVGIGRKLKPELFLNRLYKVFKKKAKLSQELQLAS